MSTREPDPREREGMADEIGRLRTRVAELEAERDSAFAESARQRQQKETWFGRLRTAQSEVARLREALREARVIGLGLAESLRVAFPGDTLPALRAARAALESTPAPPADAERMAGLLAKLSMAREALLARQCLYDDCTCPGCGSQHAPCPQAAAIAAIDSAEPGRWVSAEAHEAMRLALNDALEERRSPYEERAKAAASLLRNTRYAGGLVGPSAIDAVLTVLTGEWAGSGQSQTITPIPNYSGRPGGDSGDD